MAGALIMGESMSESDVFNDFDELKKVLPGIVREMQAKSDAE